jgi:guanylate kinase
MIPLNPISIFHSNIPGNIFVVSAPSGAGKTTLCRELAKRFPTIQYTISYTTRQPREGEINGVHYRFVDRQAFMYMLHNGEFAEWAEVYGNLYGTSINDIQSINSVGNDVIMDIDTNGAMQIKNAFERAALIFILPPSYAILKSRLIQRKTDSAETIQKRLNKIEEELSYLSRFDYLVVNDDITKSLYELESIVISTKLKTKNINPLWKEVFSTEAITDIPHPHQQKNKLK